MSFSSDDDDFVDAYSSEEYVPTDEEKANSRHYDNVARQLHMARSYAHKVDVLGNVFIKGAGLMGLYVAASKAASWLKERRKEMK
tara:strand:+ start:108 stop:362 length:255 start_codon:yes stop_codon:yes gene_type:complete